MAVGTNPSPVGANLEHKRPEAFRNNSDPRSRSNLPPPTRLPVKFYLGTLTKPTLLSLLVPGSVDGVLAMAGLPPTSDMEALSLGVADAPPPSNRTIKVLDQEGDLRLEIGPELAPFLVDSRALARASPVWRRSLFGDAATTQRVQGRPWIVQLPNDNEQALSFLLGVAHGILPKSPESFRPHDVYALSVAAAKFDMVHLLRPWAQGWCAPLMWTGVTDFRSCAGWLRVGWELGHAMLFNYMATQILTHVEATGDGDLVDPNGKLLSSNPSFASMELLRTWTHVSTTSRVLNLSQWNPSPYDARVSFRICLV